VAAVGHDLRTPLNNVVLSAELLRMQITAPGEARVLERLSASAERMAKMIDELFDLARARQGGGIPITRQQNVDLLPVAERIVVELGAAATGRELGLQQQGDLHGDWDPDRLGQVLANLLGNALRHGSSEGPVQLQLNGTDAARVVIEVRNRGQIPPEVLSCLFEPFRRGRARTGSKEGLGLGLFIVEQIVLAHGGTINAESVDGATTFRVSLPRIVPGSSRASPGA
jgi:signal transduction histidine kinase